MTVLCGFGEGIVAELPNAAPWVFNEGWIRGVVSIGGLGKGIAAVGSDN